MRKPIATALSGLLLVSSLALSTPSHAGEMNSSEASVVLTSMIVVSVPLAASIGLVELSAAPFKASASRAEKPRRSPARPMPEMEVKAVETIDKERCVQLQVPGHEDQTATLRWPQVEGHDPAARFSVGQTVKLTPTEKGSGWTVRDDQQQLLAYVPTEAAAEDNLSATW